MIFLLTIARVNRVLDHIIDSSMEINFSLQFVIFVCVIEWQNWIYELEFKKNEKRR